MQGEAQQLLGAARAWLAEWLEEGVTGYAPPGRAGGARAGDGTQAAAPQQKARSQHTARAAQETNAAHEAGAASSADDTPIAGAPRQEQPPDSHVPGAPQQEQSDAAHESVAASSADDIPITDAPRQEQPDVSQEADALSQDQHELPNKDEADAAPQPSASHDTNAPLQSEGERDPAQGQADAGSDEQEDQPSLFGAPAGAAARAPSGKAEAPASVSAGTASGKAQTSRASVSVGAATAGATGGGAASGGAAGGDAATEGAAQGDPPEGRRSLAEVRIDLGDCTRCGLCKGRTQIVFGDGNEDADLMFIGEGPGEQEDAQGIPFVGRAGELLTKMIEDGLKTPREEVYICNIVKCRPPGNRDPKPDEVAACRPFLDGQIAAVRPRVIVALGKPAASLLLGRDVAITRERGQWKSYRGIPVMPTFHPAYVLRRPTVEIRKLVWQDLLAAQAKSREGQPG